MSNRSPLSGEYGLPARSPDYALAQQAITAITACHDALVTLSHKPARRRLEDILQDAAAPLADLISEIRHAIDADQDDAPFLASMTRHERVSL